MHDRSFFPNESLAQPSSERRCLGSAGRVWICPHWIFDHNLVTTSAEPQRSHECGNKRVYVLAIVLDKGTTPTVIWPITVLRGKYDTPPKKVVDDILSLMNTSFCKHLRSTEAYVARLYSPDCKKLRWTANPRTGAPYCWCSSCVWQLSQPNLAEYVDEFFRYKDIYTGGKCESCGTDVYFEIQADKNGQETLQLVVQRKIGRFWGCTDPAWIEQVTDPAKFEELEREWYVATKKQ